MSILTDYLTSIADAIRAKKGTTELIPAANFAEEIASIETGGSELVLTELSVTQNGIYLPGEGVDGFSGVTVNVPSTALENGVVVNEVDANGKWVDVTVYGDVQAYAFYNQKALERVTFVNCTAINTYGFYGCSALENITIPGSVVDIGSYAFSNCTALTSLVIPEGITIINNGTFSSCKNLTTIEIPGSVESIGADAFNGCSSLKNVSLPENITKIDSNTFRSCESLESIVIPNNVTSINNYAFAYCSSLTNLVIPDNVKSLSMYAFGWCTGLLSVQIGSSIECAISSISTSAFYKDTGITGITIYKTIDAISGSPWGATNATVTWALAE